jgi:putative phosphoribosyl transferase
MVVFEDRKDAGRRLAKALEAFKSKADTLVLALPRGGIIVGYEVAEALHLPLDIVCPRKIGAPFNPEYAIGAVTETGEWILSEEVISSLDISEAYIKKMIQYEKEEATRRLQQYRPSLPPRQLKQKTVILVDDGLATGSTMRAAIKTCRAEGASTIVLAIPVAPPETFQKLQKEVDQAYCLTTPQSFFAVGQFYHHFDQVFDEEVIDLLSKQSKVFSKP